MWTDFLLYGDGPEREKAMEEARRFSRDFSRITVDDEGLELLTPIHCATLFKRHASWLEPRLAEPFDGATVVVTHFAPSAGSVAPRYAGSPLNACFVSNLDTLVEKVALRCGCMVTPTTASITTSRALGCSPTRAVT
ncbi:MAG: hypothetical protein M5R42_09730 [Rhodocyclaceae bacterium]|nr:hypothetical protein [Rhodocyclaceae bacterium]